MKVGIEALRSAVNVFNDCSETFNQKYTVDQLIKIYNMYQLCEYDYLPDTWTNQQIEEALKGHLPRWDNEEQPIYNPNIR